jgi:hypothetical protein
MGAFRSGGYLGRARFIFRGLGKLGHYPAPPLSMRLSAISERRAPRQIALPYGPTVYTISCIALGPVDRRCGGKAV